MDVNDECYIDSEEEMISHELHKDNIKNGEYRVPNQANAMVCCCICGWGGSNLEFCRVCSRYFHLNLCDNRMNPDSWYCNDCLSLTKMPTKRPVDPQRLRPNKKNVSLYIGPPTVILSHFVDVYAPRTTQKIISGKLFLAFEDEGSREEFVAIEKREELKLQATAYLHGLSVPIFKDPSEHPTNDRVMLQHFWPLDRPYLDQVETNFRWFQFNHSNEESLKSDLLYLQRHVKSNYSEAFDRRAIFYKGRICKSETINHSWTHNFSIRFTETNSCVACIKLGKPIIL